MWTPIFGKSRRAGSYECCHHRSVGLYRTRLCGAHARPGHSVSAVSLRTQQSPEVFAGCQAVVNLAGEPVAQRWTAAARERISSSRIQGTRSLVAALRPHPPQVLVSASAIGYYGSRGDEILTEDSPPASDFLGQLAVGWEQEARVAEQFGVRVVTPRIGVVLGRGGGALAQMLLPFRLGVGGRLGTGAQWMSWIASGRSGRIDRICDSQRRRCTAP